MRIYYLALALFTVNIAIQMVTLTGLFPLYHINAQTGYDTAVQQYTNASYSTTGISSQALGFGFGDFVKALHLFVNLIWNSITGFSSLLVLFGFPSGLVAFIQILMLFIFAAGIIQFISGRGFKDAS